MNLPIAEKRMEERERKEEVLESAVEFVKQLEVLRFDKESLRFEGDLSSKEILSYKNRLIKLINSVDKLD